MSDIKYSKHSRTQHIQHPVYRSGAQLSCDYICTYYFVCFSFSAGTEGYSGVRWVFRWQSRTEGFVALLVTGYMRQKSLGQILVAWLLLCCQVLFVSRASYIFTIILTQDAAFRQNIVWEKMLCGIKVRLVFPQPPFHPSSTYILIYICVYIIYMWHVLLFYVSCLIYT